MDSPRGGEIMAERKNSEARIKSNNKWTNAHYDRINLAVPKGRKAEIQALAGAEGQSVNGFIIAAIDEKIERDSGGTPPTRPQETLERPRGVGMVSLPSEAIKTAQAAAEAAGEAVPVFVARAVETQAKRDKIARGLDKGSGLKRDGAG